MPEDESRVRHLILATAGHVDHGKTALIKALTGIDADRLPEEKARGITIDLGFAHLALPGFSIGVIDVPGHEDFVRNMIAGIGSIDLALLVVAADDGWMPQTEEHLQILQYLGVQRGVVAITKSDLAEATRTVIDVRQRLQGTSLGEFPLVQTSARTGRGLDELKEALTLACGAIPAAHLSGKARLFVDRVFTMRGSGTVVTGTLTGGELRRGQPVALQPQNLRAHVRALQSHNQPLEVALPATRTALNLPELRPVEIPRGSVVTAMGPVESSRTVDVFIERSARDFPPSRPLRSASLIQVHYGSARFTARIILLEGRELFPGARSIARLRFATPIFAFVGDRFIIRDSSGRQTVAGGFVLDPAAQGKRFRSPATREFLQARAAAPNDLAILIRSQLRRDHFCARSSLLLKSGFRAEEIADEIDRLAGAGEIFANEAIAADGAWWRELRRRAMEAVDSEHAAHPEYPGLDWNRLRVALAIENEAVGEALIADLNEHGFVSSKGKIKRQSHRPTLPASLAKAGATIRALLEARPLDPPSRKELSTDSAALQALRFLSEIGEVILLNDEVVLSAAAFEGLKKLVLQSLGERGSATVSELRQATGTTRRIIVPFLERLDRLALTTRAGDRRKLR